MIRIVSVEQMRRIEAAADAGGLTYDTMMQNAGKATARHALAMLGNQPDARVTVLVGKGNNGGDGLVAARVLAQESSALVRCYLLQKRPDDVLVEAARQAGVHIADAEDDQGFRVLRQMIGSAHLVLDALFGIGIRLPLQGDVTRLLQVVNNTLEQVRAIEAEERIINPAYPAASDQKSRPPYVLAVDCPSGLNCDTGEVDTHAIPADDTMTFIAAKPGLFTFPGAALTGNIVVATIGVPDDLPELKEVPLTLVDAEYTRQRLPKRPVNSHKGTYGKALVIGGSANYRGAIALATQATYRTGAGLVTTYTTEETITSVAGHVPEATWLPQNNAEPLSLADYDALLIGPGWGRAQSNQALLEQLLNHNPPALIIDADGLNLLSEQDHWWQKLPPDTVITPHPGEMSRLSGLSTHDIQANRQEIAVQKAAEWQVMLLLKGAHTLIAAPDGRVAMLPFKTDALAKAGSGDVLSGVIAGLLAQGLNAFDAAAVGGYVHGLAAVLAHQHMGTSRSVMASDVIAHLSSALTRIERAASVEA